MAATMPAGAASPSSPPEPPAQRLATEAYVDKRIAELKADLYRALWIQGLGLVSVQVAIAAALVNLLGG